MCRPPKPTSGKPSASRRAPRPRTESRAVVLEHAATDPDAPRKALDTYRGLLAIDPMNADGLFQSALLEAKAGQFATSIALLARLPPDAQGRPPVLALRTAGLADSGDPAAMAAANQLAAHPDVVAEDVLVVLPAFVHGKADDVLARVLLALEKRGIARPEFLRRLADIHMRRGDFVAARATLEKLGGDAPPVPVLLDLARAADKAGDLPAHSDISPMRARSSPPTPPYTSSSASSAWSWTSRPRRTNR